MLVVLSEILTGVFDLVMVFCRFILDGGGFFITQRAQRKAQRTRRVFEVGFFV